MTITNTNRRLSGLRTSSRPAAVAGSFYPADRAKLRKMVNELLAQSKPTHTAPKALVVPHAGYIYSGPLAAQAYKNLVDLRKRITRVVLLGPAHRVYTQGIAAPSVLSFNTPLGDIPLDQTALQQITRLPQVSIFNQTHQNEHSLEVHLPFLQMSLEKFTLVPLVVGDATPAQVEEVLSLLWGGPETLVVISSDLSHFHEYAQARQLDAQTAAAIENFNYTSIRSENACGCRPLNGLLKLAAERKLSIERLGLCNSGDTAGPKERVVGYGAWVLNEPESPLAKFSAHLLGVARRSIEQGLQENSAYSPDVQQYQGLLADNGASFVTLKIDGQLRGCIGSTQPVRPLVLDVAQNAFNAANRDPRFKPLIMNEYRNTHISLSILSPTSAIEFEDESSLIDALRPGMDGLIISVGHRSATFLPSVWENLPNRKQFFKQLKQKAGIAVQTPVEKAWRYTTESFS